MPLRGRLDRFNDYIFAAAQSRSLIYNACWEDPAVDRLALDFQADDQVMVISSAGCNALDYALTGPAAVHAVDVNPRQIALLELKLAAIRELTFNDFFALFGHGRHPGAERLYRAQLRRHLSAFSLYFWDRNIGVFNAGERRLGGLYFFGLAGKVARLFHGYLRLRPRIRRAVEAMLDAPSLGEQREIFDEQIAAHLWRSELNWALSRQFTMTLLGVPAPQRDEVARQHRGGVAGFVRDCVARVFRELPLSANYFWRVYLTGQYTRECCPEYLKETNFQALQDGMWANIHLHTATVTDFLTNRSHDISKFVLLDHMDWMSSVHPDALREEWEAIFSRGRPGARVIFRSAHAWPQYLESVMLGNRKTPLMSLLTFYPELARRLQCQDRVRTYAGFHIADMGALS